MKFATNRIQLLRAKLHGKGLDDPRLLGLIVLACIGLSVIWNGVRVVQQNYGLLQKISLIQEQNQIILLENRNKEIQNEYFATAEFAELKARRLSGRAAEGERVYVITNETAESYLQTPAKKTLQSSEIEAKPRYQQNFEAWVDFFFGDKST